MTCPHCGVGESEPALGMCHECFNFSVNRSWNTGVAITDPVWCAECGKRTCQPGRAFCLQCQPPVTVVGETRVGEASAPEPACGHAECDSWCHRAYVQAPERDGV